MEDYENKTYFTSYHLSGEYKIQLDILNYSFNQFPLWVEQIPAHLCCPLLGPGTCLQPGIQLLGQPALLIRAAGGGEHPLARKPTPDTNTVRPKVKSRENTER